MIPIFDHHIHMDARNAGDYEHMALAGVRWMLTPCSATHEIRRHTTSWQARFERLLGFEVERAAQFGVDLRLALAVSAVDVGDHWQVAMEAVEDLPHYLSRPAVAALGELCLRRFSRQEVELFERQLALAEGLRLPVMIEAPVPLRDFERLLKVLADALSRGLVQAGRICLLDLDFDKLALARELDLGAYGLPAAPQLDRVFCLRPKVDAGGVQRIVERWGADRLMLNSGLHVGNADPLGLARVVYQLELAGVAPSLLYGLAKGHADTFFKMAAA